MCYRVPGAAPSLEPQGSVFLPSLPILTVPMQTAHLTSQSTATRPHAPQHSGFPCPREGASILHEGEFAHQKGCQVLEQNGQGSGGVTISLEILRSKCGT